MILGALKIAVTMVLFKSFKKAKRLVLHPPSYKPTYGSLAGFVDLGGGTWPQELWYSLMVCCSIGSKFSALAQDYHYGDKGCSLEFFLTMTTHPVNGLSGGSKKLFVPLSLVCPTSILNSSFHDASFLSVAFSLNTFMLIKYSKIVHEKIQNNKITHKMMLQ